MPNQDDIREPFTTPTEPPGSGESVTGENDHLMTDDDMTTEEFDARLKAGEPVEMTNFLVQDQNAGMDEILAIATDGVDGWLQATRQAVQAFHADVLGAMDTSDVFIRLVRAAAAKEPDQVTATQLTELVDIMIAIQRDFRHVIRVTMNAVRN